MQCDEFDKRLQNVLDDRHCPDADEQLCHYADQDDAIAARLRIAELIASPPPLSLAPSANFAERVLQRIREEDAAEMRLKNAPFWKHKSFWMGGAGLAVAASVAVALNLWTAPPQVEPGGAGANVVKNTPKAEIPHDPHAVASGEELPTWEDGRLALAGLSKKLDVRPEKVDQLQDGLKPLKSTFNVTLHVIRSTVPNRPAPAHPRQRTPEGKSSTAIFGVRWYA